MGEEVNIDDSVTAWESGLPSLDDLTPLSQPLIPAELASAFKISPEPSRTMLDVNRASQQTLTALRGSASGLSLKPFTDHALDVGEPAEGSNSKKSRRVDLAAEDAAAMDNCGDDQSTSTAKTLKRARLVWTPQLHKRFVDVVAHLGLKNAVPKAIMQLMNVEGLTRENVASHLQKYRLYVKRMQGLSNEGPSLSDHLFSSTPVPPQSFNESSGDVGHGNGRHSSNGNGSGNGNGNGSSGISQVGMPIRLPYPPPPQMIPMPMMGMPYGNGFHGYESDNSHHYPHNYGSMVQNYNGYPHHVAQNNNNS